MFPCSEKLTFEESPWAGAWLPPTVGDDAALAIILWVASDSFVGLLLAAVASGTDVPFFARFDPEVVETFQTSCMNCRVAEIIRAFQEETLK